MSTEFIAFIPPPGDSIQTYNRAVPASEQPDTIPPHFIDAMTVREQVFVQEQKVPLENEFDSDDALSYHWVVFASVSSNVDKDTGRKGSQGARKPVGVIRLIPPEKKQQGQSERSDNCAPDIVKKTSLYDGKEPFATLGRLATLKAYRSLGLGKLLVNAAVEWAIENPDSVLQPLSPVSKEAAAMGTNDERFWNGLFLVHAQTNIQHVWERLGFKKDEELGNWDEEGIDHVAMWKRVEVIGR